VRDVLQHSPPHGYGLHRLGNQDCLNETFGSAVHLGQHGGADVFELIPALAGRLRYVHVTSEPPDDADPPPLGPDPRARS
jgi:hypothetical protein